MTDDLAEPDILADLAATRKPSGIPCVRARIARDQPELLEAFDKGVRATEFSNENVARWLRGRGVDIGQEAIRYHRNGQCALCRKTTS